MRLVEGHTKVVVQSLGTLERRETESGRKLGPDPFGTKSLSGVSGWGALVFFLGEEKHGMGTPQLSQLFSGKPTERMKRVS